MKSNAVRIEKQKTQGSLVSMAAYSAEHEGQG